MVSNDVPIPKPRTIFFKNVIKQDGYSKYQDVRYDNVSDKENVIDTGIDVTFMNNDVYSKESVSQNVESTKGLL